MDALLFPAGPTPDRDGDRPLVQGSAADAPALDLRRPAEARSPLVFACPHAGRIYPDDMRPAAGALALRRLEDAWVDELVDQAPDLGVPLLIGRIARAYLDLNRDPFELDQSMFDAPLPALVSRRTARVAAGLGTIARLAEGEEIYARKLSLAEVEQRVARVHVPYHAALADLLAQTRSAHGGAILIDWHSMPASAARQAAERGRRPADIILGDRHGHACQPAFTDHVEGLLRDLGFSVTRNHPYAGGYTTQHYGAPDTGLQALQIEINRSLYMDEATLTRTDGFAPLRALLASLIQSLAATAAPFL